MNHKLGINQWMSLAASVAGWMLDAMDWMMLALALPLIKVSFNASLPELGLLATATLAGAAIGGVVVGILADYYGRIRILTFTILWYSVFTAACGFAQSYEQLLVLRVLTGLGLGGEWAVGATLVSEFWPDKYRAKATSFVHSGWPIGYGLAALANMYVVPLWGWQGLFWVGSLPAIFAVIIRLQVPEPEAWLEAKKLRSQGGVRQARQQFPLTALFSKALFARTCFAGLLSAGMLMAYWGSATWLPSFLSTAKGLNIVKTSGFLIVLNLGAFLGYQFYGWVADRFGRRVAFISGTLGAIVCTLIYVNISDEQALLYFGPIFGFATYGFFGPIGAYVSELFPTESRATGASVTWNFGRAMSMLSPVIIGAVAQAHGLAWGLGTTMIFNFIALLSLFFLPETVKAGVKLLFPDLQPQAAAAPAEAVETMGSEQ
jgi:MFS family permease